MEAVDIARQLETIRRDHDFGDRSAELVDEWVASALGVEAIEPILRFMESYPNLEYGTPGALVHFVERFYGKGYEGKLVESVKRRPTLSSVWMLNRLINGTQNPEDRRLLIEILEQARLNPLADHSTLQRIDGFLERLSK